MRHGVLCRASLWLALSVVFGGGFAIDSAQASQKKRFYFGPGVIARDLGVYAVSTDGSASTFRFSDAMLQISASFWIPVKTWYMTPFGSWTPAGMKDSEGGSITRLLLVGLRGSRSVGNWDVRIGTGAFLTTVSGIGGTFVTPNGNSEATAALPSGDSRAQAWFASLGLGYEAGRFRAEVEAFLETPLETRRAVSLAATLSYGFF